MTQRVALPFMGLDPLPWSRPALATFSTWLNQGSSTASDGTLGRPLVITTTGAAVYTPVALLKSIGAPPWTITTGQAVVSLQNNSTGNSESLVLVLNNSGSAKAVAIQWTAIGGLTIYHYGNTAPNNAPSNISGAGMPPSYFAWFKVVNDGTHVTFYFSLENIHYVQFYQEASNALVSSFDTVGFGVERTNIDSPGNEANAILWSWVES